MKISEEAINAICKAINIFSFWENVVLPKLGKAKECFDDECYTIHMYCDRPIFSFRKIGLVDSEDLLIVTIDPYGISRERDSKFFNYKERNAILKYRDILYENTRSAHVKAIGPNMIIFKFHYFAEA